MISQVPRSSKIAMTMRKIGFIAALVVAMTAVSCVQEMNTEIPAPETSAVTFDATFDASATKAVLDGTTGKVAWETDDQVSILVGDGNYLYTATQGGATTTLTTQAEGVPSEGTYYAVFPYDEAAAMAGENLIATTLPAEQTAVLGSFTTHLAVAQTTGNKLAFKNVCGLVKVNVSAENVTKIVFEGNNEEIVAGDIEVTVSDTPSWERLGGDPDLASLASVRSTPVASTSVTLVPAEGQTILAKGDYYFAVLPQTFTHGFKVTAYKGDEASVIRNVITEVVIARAGMIAGKSFGIDGSGTEEDPYILKTPQDMVDMRSLAKLGGETWFKMANSIDMKGIDWVPVNYDQNFERKIHFDGGDFTISNLTSDKSVHGANYPSFMGVVYGSVKNLKFDNAVIKSTSGCGVVGGYVGTDGKDGLVENVTVTNSSVTNSGDRAGGICGTARQGTFKNVSFQGTVTSTYVPKDPDKEWARSGGFVGYTQSSASFENCSVDVTVEGAGNCIGGFAGFLTGTTTLKNCVGNKATVTSTYTASQAKAGGFVGSANTGQTFDNCDGEFIVTVSNSDAAGFAGYIAGTNTFKNCDVKTTLVSKVLEKNRCGGFIGWNNSNGTLTVENCHVLEGSTIKDESGRTANKSVNYGGFIGYGDNDGAVVNIKNCSAKLDVDSGKFGVQAAAFVGSFGYESTVTIENSYAEGDVIGQNYSAGFVGYCGTTTNVTIMGCHFSGTVAGNSSVAGLVGAVDSGGVLKICKSYATGTVNPSGTNSGGIIGAVNGTATVEDCWVNVTLNMPSNQYGGAIVGFSAGTMLIKNCYSLGFVNVSRGCGGIAGQVRTTSPTVDGCIAWCKIKTSRSNTQYSPGAVVGNIQVNGNFRNCYRKYDMDFTDVAMKLVDHENVENGRPPLPTYEGTTADKNQYAYHGKAAGEGETISEVASRLGWSEDIWDLSGDVPVLK